jgi:hypothetical protein
MKLYYLSFAILGLAAISSAGIPVYRLSHHMCMMRLAHVSQHPALIAGLHAKTHQKPVGYVRPADENDGGGIYIPPPQPGP